MTKSLTEFKRFLAKSATAMSEHEKRLANLMLDRFVDVADSGAASGRRGKLIAKLIVEKGDSASSEFKLESDEAPGNESPIIRLKKITVENFRGFSDKLTFEFKNPYTFVYGPNGTGKTSLCEALEFGLLGSISEADAKRIQTADYIRNATSKKSSKPVLYGDTSVAEDVVVDHDPARFEFCFIEKNRIDGFARVAANTPAAQQTRLAALFGLEEFNSFATQFNESIESYLDCVGKKGKELSDREKGIAGHKAILAGLPEKAKDAETRSAVLLAKYPECQSLAKIKGALSGSDGSGGKQKTNNAEIARLQTIKPASDPRTDEISIAVDGLLKLFKEKVEAQIFLNEYKEQLSLRDLYDAVLSNREKFDNVCPACSSELYRDGILVVPVDPYDHAAGKLKQFDTALKAEKRIKEIRITLDSGWRDLQAKLAKLPSAASSVSFARMTEIESFCEAAANIKEEADIEGFLSVMHTLGEMLQALKDAVAKFNVEVDQSKAAIKTLEEENLVITKDLEEIVAISTLIDANTKSEAISNEALEKFNQENETLIREVEAEKPRVARNLAYCFAYDSFRRKLLDYNTALPISLAAELNEKTLKFYNEINKNDQPSDKLKSLTLPTVTGDKIQIEFNDGDKCDALHVLSEGHTRCLGLAILLAKIIRDDLPFLIFDDVVNSIDDEHRGSIIDLILNANEVGKRQLIVTTHGEDFVKRLENAIPTKQYKEMVTRIDFLVPFSAKKIAVKLDSPRHYLVVASQSYEEGRIRDSLSYVRKSFEDLLNRLWKKIANNKLSVQINVGMRGPGSPDLMSLATGLLAFLEKKDVTVFQEAIPHLAEILGQGEKHKIEWNYLNKGTHEEDQVEEFDASVVRHMLETVMKLDEAVDGSSGG